jgi:hypothetical protein
MLQHDILNKVFIKPAQTQVNGTFAPITQVQANQAQAQCIPGHCNGQCQGG